MDAARRPEVSVVMAVHDGAHHLRAGVDSILAQRDVELELVAVDDGSSDATGEILATYGRTDSRVRVLTLPHSGLTAALAAGCAEARGEFIARQDAGDVSHPDRLREQVSRLRADPGVVLVSCFTRFFGPRGETVSIAEVRRDALEAGLRARTLDRLRGPSSHGSVTFRAEVYRRTGGYRPKFRVAQDIDLWLRMASEGRVEVVPAVHYEAESSPTGITAMRRSAQVESARVALDAAIARDRGEAEELVLARLDSIASAMRPEPKLRARWHRAAYLYFLGRCQAKTNRQIARAYYRDAISVCPWHVRSLGAWVLSGLTP